MACWVLEVEVVYSYPDEALVEEAFEPAAALEEVDPNGYKS